MLAEHTDRNENMKIYLSFHDPTFRWHGNCFKALISGILIPTFSRWASLSVNPSQHDAMNEKYWSESSLT